MSFLKQEFNKLYSSRKYLGVLIIWVVVLRAISTLLFFKKNGLRSSYGGDIWFFMGVAQGHARLFWADPLQYVLPLFGGLSPESLFDLLLVSSNLFHLVSVTLLFLLCLEMTQKLSASFWAASFYSVTMTAFNFCTASFHHQQTALPLLILCLWISWRIYSNGFTWLRGISLLLLSLLSFAIGPDILVVLSLLIPLGVIRLQKHAAGLIPIFLMLLWMLCLIWVRDEMNPSAFRMAVIVSGVFLAIIFWIRRLWQNWKWIFPFLVLSVWVGVLFLFGPWGERFFQAAAAKSRGIDLTAQKMLLAEDLLPFGFRELWAAYPWMAFIFIALFLYSWKRERFFEGFVVVTALLFAGFAARFYFITEIGFALVIAWFLSIQTRPRMVQGAGAALVSVLIVIAAMRGVACLYPGIIWNTLEPLRKETDKKLVLCTPTYGFLVRSLTGHKPTSDWHHLNDVWIRIASQSAESASVELKQMGVGYAFLTSIDLRVVEADVGDGIKAPLLMGSGGFETFMPSVVEDVQETFGFRVLYGPQNLGGLTILHQDSTRDGESKAVLARFH